ncbi:hypothetical protein F511_25759 [Dorcoceras hygrometricum]|uniref:Uncharacterized protein n=1 Tax=Dorcoceras hygrometricum TaxID=472368 RepID=A0A2Z7CBS3_9LAMI|nr:hypothetical protein F511_25759 [Dorcoceras hygrometricum]
MGACASIPKAMRAEVIAAPPPEQPKEETPLPTAAVEPEEAKVVVENDKSQSLGTLLIEEEAPKEPKGNAESEIEEEEARAGPLPVSEPVAPVASEAEEKLTRPTA